MSATTDRELLQAINKLTAAVERLASPLTGERRLATLDEAMALVGCKRRRLFQLVKAGKIKRVLEGAKAHFDVPSIEAYLAGQVEGSGRKRGRPKKQRAAPADPELAAIAKLKIP